MKINMNDLSTQYLYSVRPYNIRLGKSQEKKNPIKSININTQGGSKSRIAI